MDIRIAVATSDGNTVDQHFGRARNFRIYRLQDASYEFLEERPNNPPCSGHEHNDQALEDAARVIEDCQAVVATQIGPTAMDVLLMQRTLPLIMGGGVDEALQTLAKTNRFKFIKRP